MPCDTTQGIRFWGLVSATGDPDSCAAARRQQATQGGMTMRVMVMVKAASQS